MPCMIAAGVGGQPGTHTSTGITFDLHSGAELVLVLLMFIGRIGPLTLGSAIALRERRILYELPKERPAIG